MAERGTEATPSGSAIWLVTFTDLVALLLTFFVMLFSMSSVKVDKWKEMIDAVTQTINPARIVTSQVPSAQFNIASVFRSRAVNVEYLNSVLAQKLAANPILSANTLVLLEDRLVISLPGNQLFQAGAAVLDQEGRQLIFNLGGVLSNVDNQLGVIGYSVSNPAEGGEFASNWELSLARATSVSNALQRAGYPRDILIFGHGDSRSSYLSDVVPARREVLSGRVDIVVMSVSRAN